MYTLQVGLPFIIYIDSFVFSITSMTDSYKNKTHNVEHLQYKKVKLTKQQKHVSMIPMSSGRLRSFTLMAPS